MHGGYVGHCGGEWNPREGHRGLEKEITEAGEVASSSRKRRAYKGVVRDAEDLLEASPAAPNRYRVLDIVFQSQKRLLAMDNSDENRDSLLETCAKLAGAPDEVADLRLEADLLLSEKALVEQERGCEGACRGAPGTDCTLPRYAG